MRTEPETIMDSQLFSGTEPQIDFLPFRKNVLPGGVLIELRDITTPGNPGLDRLSLEVRECEMLGILFSGKPSCEDAFLSFLSGSASFRGRIRMAGKNVSGIRAGKDIVFITPPPAISVFSEWTVEDEILLHSEKHKSFWKGGFLRRGRLRQYCVSFIESCGLHISPSAPISSISVQDRHFLQEAAALRCSSKVLIALEPFRCLHPHQVRMTAEALGEKKLQHCGIILISENKKMLLDFCDRILIIREGRIVRTVHTEYAVETDLD